MQPANETLKVSAVARDRVTEPGAHDTVDVSVAGADGSPVAGADVAVVVVDEAVLSLTGYKLADPIAAMYAPQTTSVRPTTSAAAWCWRTPRCSARPRDHADDGRGANEPCRATRAARPAGRRGHRRRRRGPAGAGAAPGPAGCRGEPTGADARPIGRCGPLDGVVDAARPQGLSVRTNFNALALFSPSVRTDAAGVAHVSVDLPDNLTRYRVMAVAADTAAGSARASRRSPRGCRCRCGRRRRASRTSATSFDLSVVVQNQTDQDMVADVVAETSNLTLTDAPAAG